jgi:hypothetical protein
MEGETMSKRIRWADVKAAMRRGKLGISRPGDDDLCISAFAEDARRYSVMKAAVDGGVTRALSMMGTADEDDHE